MKKIIKFIKMFFLIIIVLGVIGAVFGRDKSSDSNSSKGDDSQQAEKADTNQQKESDPVEEIEYTAVDISQMMDELDENAMKAQESYKGKYLEITGRLINIDASGKYITLARLDDNYAIIGVHCSLKNSDQKAQVAEMSTDDVVTLRGKCSDVGEVMGYTLDVDSIDGFEPTEGASVETVDGYIVRTADKLEEELKENALKAQNTYKNNLVAVTGRVSNFDSNGKYINISPLDNPYSLTIIQCYIKSDDIKAIVMELSKDDVITVKGKCTDVGELLGYSINIETIE